MNPLGKLPKPKLGMKPVLAKVGRVIPASFKEKYHRQFGAYAPDFWLWAGMTCLLTFTVVLMLAKIFLMGGHLTGQAIESGQQVVIDLENGDVTGNARHTQDAPPKTDVGAPPTGDVAAAANKDGLAPAPLASLSEQSDKGVLPVASKDGVLAWKYYARPFTVEAKRPIVAIVITDLGLSKNQTEDALKLPHNFTLSFSPYAGDARKWATFARAQGFETLVDLPMQSMDYVRNGYDPGPYGLLEEAEGAQNSDRLHSVLSRFSGYVGVLAPENESMTANLTAIRPSLTELTARGVLFLYIKTSKNEGLIDLFKSHQLAGLGIDKVIDDVVEPGAIEKQLAALTEIARTQGYAVGFAHGYPPTIATLNLWTQELGEQGIDLAPVSAVALKVLP